MPSRSAADLLSLSDPDSQSHHQIRLPRVMMQNLDDEHRSSERRIIVANHLPLVVAREPTTGGRRFSWDPDALALQLRSGLPEASEVFHVGTLRADVDPSEQEEVASHLYQNFRCLPVFLSTELHRKFYHGFCKHYLWPLFHYHLPLSPLASHRFDVEEFRAYISANIHFADKVMELVSSVDDDLVWVHDYHLLALPTFLRKRAPRIKLGFFLHSPFPSSEIFKTIPVREDLLRALLNSDLIGFHTFDYARHFLSSCSRLLGLDYQAKRGYIGIEYYGRTVGIKILPVGIDMSQLTAVVARKETEDKVEELRERFEGKQLLLGVDDVDVFKGIGLKFLAMEILLAENPRLVGRVVLVQIANPARSQGRDVQEVYQEIRDTAARINARFGKPGYDPIVLIDTAVPTFEKVAYYALADCVVVNPVRDGLNLVAYKYTVCRQWSPALAAYPKKKSVIVVSEFIGCSPSLSGAIRVNPWSVDAVAEGIYLAITMSDEEKQLRHDKHYKYVSSHDVAYWAKSFDQDLQRACKDHDNKSCWGMGLGLGFRIMALDPNFKRLSVENIEAAYVRTNNRLILLDYDGTMMPEGSIDRTPSKEVISVLNGLCADPKNVVFVVSGRGKDSLGKWFSPCERLGISAEHGYFTRWRHDSPWEAFPLGSSNFDWKKNAEPVMKHYTEATDGSYIEHKESALVWHHQEADPDFGSWQAKELLDHLESVLANEPVAVKRGQAIVENHLQGISKGVAVTNLISTMVTSGKPPDFVLCIGDDRSDEDMFESIKSAVNNPSMPGIAEVFDCTIGKKPSKAKYYLDDTDGVINMLQSLAAASAQPSKSPHPQVSFEGSL
ncbi:putative alpha,alpha-trehalose-phosphate synthase [UDP-forming] 9 [Iris pallida]|uniref:Alpha,alpha-trehalose-phosphate synthase [UDP-forming] 9 n=1 Tax=Iris pallida TaxID=29817 RepID=A0AAX6EIT8_IRIPA|nr:putative alpha,alpha-trehalose-phosphate synthase [UDP-forming] 9 [Iris pallida]